MEDADFHRGQSRIFEPGIFSANRQSRWCFPDRKVVPQTATEFPSAAV
jgi:hypothetical protein